MATLLDLPVVESTNFGRIQAGHDLKNLVRKRAQQYVIKKGSDGRCAIALVDVRDIAEILSYMRERQLREWGPSHDTDSYYLMEGDRVLAWDGKEAALSLSDLELGREERLSIGLLAKIYGGAKHLSGAEVTWLRRLDWKNPEKRDEFLALLEEHLPFFPELVSLKAEVQQALSLQAYSSPKGLLA